jgi:Leucine-rich repeat (LRR) protein
MPNPGAPFNRVSSPIQPKSIEFMPRRLLIILLIPLWGLLTACESYDISVNEKLVYSPAPLFSAFNVADPALQECLEQAVIDGKVTSAAQLAILNCSHAGVADLSGLEIFTGIAKLKLSSNDIQNISPLASLTILELLLLDNNGIIDSTPLLGLTALLELDLTGNSALLCPSSASLINLDKLTLPEHCL